ncbi:hypothetical protein HPB49_004433 [Dermacentor silvarum]|uniref:Uncharacterized protein n=1 Tax=Dermacentor silvarum TaxID=543639 RepID=A0ACB8DUH1_DERSI|nr:hypothetical protein HPB49_004433 [Dermacentor silvarum]
MGRRRPQSLYKHGGRHRSGVIGRATHRLRRLSATSRKIFHSTPATPLSLDAASYLETKSPPGAIWPATPPPLLGLTAAAAPGESGHPTRATGDKMAGQKAGMRGYDPDAMIWTTVSTTENGEPAPPSTFKSAALAAAVARRTRDRVLTVAVSDAASAGAPTTGVCHDKPPPHASPTAGNKGKHSVAWKPLPLPKPAPEEFVVVIKPKTRVSLSEAFQEPGLGRAFIAYLGPASVQVITVLPVREQNIILVYTLKPEIADKIIGDFDLNSVDGRVPLTGHLRQDGGNVCYGVVTVRNTDTEETLSSSLQWRQGEILEIRKFGTSNKARLTLSGKEKPRYVHYEAVLIQVRPYQRTIPACGHCGVVGHCIDACPGPRPEKCGVCGQPAQLLDGARESHKCTPKCSLCGGAHATGDGTCTAKYRPLQPKRSDSTAKRTKRRRKSANRPPPQPKNPGGPQSRGASQQPGQSQVPGKPAAPSTDMSEKHPAAPPPSRGTAAKQHANPSDTARTWVNAVLQGSQVSGKGRAAPSHTSPPPKSKPPQKTAEQIEIAALKEQIASAPKLTFSNICSPPAEDMDNSSSVPEMPTHGHSTTEARLSAMETHMMTRFNALEAQVTAALKAAIDKIPCLIAAHTVRALKRIVSPNIKVDRPQMTLAEKEPTPAEDAIKTQGTDGTLPENAKATEDAITEVDMAETGSGPVKRTREETGDTIASGVSETTREPPTKAATSRRQPFKPVPNLTTDRRTNSTPPPS